MNNLSKWIPASIVKERIASRLRGCLTNKCTCTDQQSCQTAASSKQTSPSNNIIMTQTEQYLCASAALLKSE